ncbi:elongin-A-like isoform X2 [Tubulanus polymorphus]|uniref:elongin-A-like isoform X2 n=1 Tax=Tubulanus polymorphus TaxID=672921 RepID=UPI003DA40DBC
MDAAEEKILFLIELLTDERLQQDESQLLKVLGKLDRVPICVELLQSTKVGLTVNAFRKYAGEVGSKAKSIIRKWKEIARAEESTTAEEDDGKEAKNDDRESENRKQKISSSSDRREHSSSTSSKSLENKKSSHGSNKHRENKTDSKITDDRDRKTSNGERRINKHSDKPSVSNRSSSQGKNSSDKDKSNRSKDKTDKSNSSRKEKSSSSHLSSSSKTSEKRNNDKLSTDKSSRDKHKSTDKSKSSSKDSHGERKKRKLEESADFLKPTTDNDDDGGRTFMDFLNYDMPAISSKKKKSGAAPPTTTKSSSPPVSAAAASSDSNDREHKVKKRKSTLTAFSIPSPTKQLNISESDILGELPVTSPDYKPIRFPGMEGPSKHQIAEEHALNMAIGTKKHNRTQVYAGRKQVYLTEVPTLFQACIRVLSDNVEELGYVGGVPYEILCPVLERCTPLQLYNIEEYNPVFISESSDLWEIHCQRDFRNYKPDEMESWRELYLRLHDEREAKLKSLTANISRAMVKKAAPERKTKLAYVDTVAKAPRDVRRRQMKFGTAGPAQSNKLNPLNKLSSRGGNPELASFKRPGTTESMRAAISASSSGVTGGSVRIREEPRKKVVPPMMRKTMTMMKKLRR